MVLAIIYFPYIYIWAPIKCETKQKRNQQNENEIKRNQRKQYEINENKTKQTDMKKMEGQK